MHSSILQKDLRRLVGEFGIDAVLGALAEIHPSEKLLHVLKDIAEALKQIAEEVKPHGIQVRGSIMFIVKADNADQPFEIKPEFTDSEGNPVPAPKNITFESSSTDDSVVSLLPDPGSDGNPPNPAKGIAHFGNPGQASLNFNVLSNGKLLGALGAQFTVVVGDPAKLSGGTVAFDGLEDV